MTNETWGQVREELIKRVGKHNYATWIEPLYRGAGAKRRPSGSAEGRHVESHKGENS